MSGGGSAIGTVEVNKTRPHIADLPVGHLTAARALSPHCDVKARQSALPLSEPRPTHSLQSGTTGHVKGSIR